MLNLQNSARLMSQACLLLGLIVLTGCHQLSKTTRAEEVIEEETMPPSPTLGPSLGPESSDLQPVPQTYPSIPLLPPPAPPADSARREKGSSEAVDNFGWHEESVADAVADAEEFFPSSASELARDVLADRTAASEARLAEAGRMANLRRAAQVDHLPVIVPGASTLRRVSAKEPKLMPVPR